MRNSLWSGPVFQLHSPAPLPTDIVPQGPHLLSGTGVFTLSLFYSAFLLPPYLLRAKPSVGCDPWTWRTSRQ